MDDGHRSAEGPASSSEGEDFTAEERERLLRRHGRRFEIGETLFQEGSPALQVFVLEEGRVRLLRRVAMSERSLGVIKPGELFGEAALVENTTYGATAVALTGGGALAMDRAAFRSLVVQYPHMALRAVDELARQLRDADDNVEILMMRGVGSRVTRALLKLAGQQTGLAEVTISPVELSSRVGLDVEAVKRAVARLRERGYVHIRGERIEIPDVDALRRLHVLQGTQDDLAGQADGTGIGASMP